MPQGIFCCGVCKFDTDSTKPPGEQEDEWYQHLRDVEHEYTYSKPCQNCGKKAAGKAKGKVPQPTPEVKNPRSMIVYCNDKCKKEYLKKLGVTS